MGIILVVCLLVSAEFYTIAYYHSLAQAIIKLAVIYFLVFLYKKSDALKCPPWKMCSAAMEHCIDFANKYKGLFELADLGSVLVARRIKLSFLYMHHKDLCCSEQILQWPN